VDADILERWAAVLDGLAADPAKVARQVEWVAKRQVLEAMRARDGLGWDAPKLRAADLRWTDVDPAASLFARLEAAGAVERLFAEAEIAWAVDHPPASTRAYLKGEALRRFPDGVAAAGWDRLALAWAGGTASFALADPLAGTSAQVGAALEEAASVEDLALRLSRRRLRTQAWEDVPGPLNRTPSGGTAGRAWINCCEYHPGVSGSAD
jgi:proteasome accessory factor A